MSVLVPTKRCATMLRGSVRSNQLFLDICTRNLRNNRDNKGARRYIPRKDAVRSNIAYPAIRNCLKNSIGVIFLLYLTYRECGTLRGKEQNMNFIKKLVDLLKKLGFLKVSGSAGAYKSSKDKGYKPPGDLS